MNVEMTGSSSACSSRFKRPAPYGVAQARFPLTAISDGRKPVLQAIGLTKRYGEQIALHPLDPCIRPGEIHCELSGKFDF